jgi:hypothetical protein
MEGLGPFAKKTLEQAGLRIGFSTANGGKP